VQYISPATEDPAFFAIGVVTHDGRRLRCYALSPMRSERKWEPRMQRLYERLNAHHEAARMNGRCRAAD
jgi:hypothetical protein